MDDNYEANKLAWKLTRQDLKAALKEHGEEIEGYGKRALALKILELLDRAPARV
jgi:hypothetical protein